MVGFGKWKLVRSTALWWYIHHHLLVNNVNVGHTDSATATCFSSLHRFDLANFGRTYIRFEETGFQKIHDFVSLSYLPPQPVNQVNQGERTLLRSHFCVSCFLLWNASQTDPLEKQIDSSTQMFLWDLRKHPRSQPKRSESRRGFQIGDVVKQTHLRTPSFSASQAYGVSWASCKPPGVWHSVFQCRIQVWFGVRVVRNSYLLESPRNPT